MLEHTSMFETLKSSGLYYSTVDTRRQHDASRKFVFAPRRQHAVATAAQLIPINSARTQSIVCVRIRDTGVHTYAIIHTY